jgi:hypothetical protein
MTITIANLAAEREKQPDKERRAALEELALSLLLLEILRWQLAPIRAYTCLLDEREKGGEDDERDAAAA